MSGSTVRRVLLVGFMGSGKSTVGPLLAGALGWRFLDFDEVVEEREGRSVPEIFRTRGEEGFRRVEEIVARKLLAEDGVVLASGGGWGAVEGRLDALPPGTASVWLRVSPEEAVRRAGPAGAGRPLLAGRVPLARARALVAARGASYARARHAVDTEGRTPPEVAERVLAILGLDVHDTHVQPH